MRHLAYLSSEPGRCCRACNECVLIAVPTGDSPRRGDAAVCAHLKSIGSLATRLHNPGWIIWISRSRICPVQTKDSCCQRQVANDVPLGAHLIVTELLRLQLLRNYCEGRDRKSVVSGKSVDLGGR